MKYAQLAKEWTALMAPSTGDIRAELVREASEFLGIPLSDAWARLAGADVRFNEEWRNTVADQTSEQELTAFYNRGDTELFELIEWHAKDPIHLRTLIVRDIALARKGRHYLDYGSGIGSDAVVFASAGFNVTLADISDCLLGFAAFRCRARGASVRTIDLKRESLPADTFDVAVCLDVLEHMPRPLQAVRDIRSAMRSGGLLAVHAPFAEDPEHPMHVVHHDVVTPRIRSMGLQPINCAFPAEIRAPQMYQKQQTALSDRVGYFLYDGYLNNAAGRRLAGWYRSLFRRRPLVAEQSS